MAEIRHTQRTTALRLAAGCVVAACWWAVGGVAVIAVSNWVSGDRPTPLWQGAALGLTLGAGTLVVAAAERAGWITIFPRTAEKKARLEELAAERKRILAEAKKNLNR